VIVNGTIIIKEEITGTKGRLFFIVKNKCPKNNEKVKNSRVELAQILLAPNGIGA